MASRSSEPRVDHPLIIRSPRWQRLAFWLCLLAGLLMVLIAVGDASTSDVAPGVGFAAAGILCCFVGWRGARLRVRIDSTGVLYSGFRTTFAPVAEIRSVELRPVAGVGPFDRAEVAVVLRSGRVVLLDPTEVVRSGPDHRRVLAQVAAIEHALSSSDDFRPHPAA